MFNNVIYFTTLDLVESFHNHVPQVMVHWLFLLVAFFHKVHLHLVADLSLQLECWWFLLWLDSGLHSPLVCVLQIG